MSLDNFGFSGNCWKVAAMVERSVSKRARALASIGFVLGALGLAGCGSSGQPSSDAPALSDNTPAGLAGSGSEEAPAGSVSLELDVAGAHIATANYTIIGPNFSTTGTLDVSHSTRISGVVAGLPFGSGYVVTLSAKSTDKPVLNCSGSAAFGVSSTALLPVTVPVACRADRDLPVVAAAAPVPPVAVAALFLLLLWLGMSLHWGAARPSTRNL